MVTVVPKSTATYADLEAVPPHLSLVIPGFIPGTHGAASPVAGNLHETGLRGFSLSQWRVSTCSTVLTQRALNDGSRGQAPG